ncbi:single-stranded-DNA-specific exonuclease RecJ [Rhodobacteraceae bacterium 63075]|nr:single-stranded-DNA-specific exonuclease RecJ [Rhodobacteraceae bacterium 63075]
MTEQTAFLGVGASLTGRRWLGPGVEQDRAAEAMAQETGLPRALSQILARRGVPPHEAESFLAPQLRDLMPDPRSLRDMEKASARLVAALDARARIAIFADYDVDGAASAALLLDWLREMGHDATLYVPDRIDEGYGPNVPAMRDLAAAHDLIICVDCGTLSHEALAAADGAEVIVLDHHLGGETLPPALAVVNPNRQDESGELAHLCAAAVVFLCLVDAGRVLREAGRKGPDLITLLDLVALATVADVAPLIGVNRAFVVQGLKIMARRARPGLAALGDIGRLDTAPKAYHLGYVLGPRINAGGRVGRADLGARLLSCRDAHEARALAEKLDMFNTERRAIEEEVRAAALTQAEARGLEAPLVWAAGDGWHAGVVGIVASRLKENANRPAIVIGFDGDAGKGSGRSVSGVDLGASVQKLQMEGLIEKGGGHKMAAGLSLSRAQLEPAMARLSELMDKQGAGALGPADLRLDGALMPGAASEALVEQLDAAGPFGASAPGPRFAFPDCAIHFARRVGESHLKVSFSDGSGQRMDAISFGAFDTGLGPALEAHGGARFHLAGRLELNTWQGRTSVQLRLEDAAPASA